MWLRLIALLHHAGEECAAPQSSQALSRLGRNKIGTARRVLHAERDRAMQILRRKGIAIDLQEIQREAQVLQGRDDLAAALQELSAAFETAALVAQLRGEAVFSRWLRQRARLHAEQHRLFAGP